MAILKHRIDTKMYNMMLHVCRYHIQILQCIILIEPLWFLIFLPQ